MSRAGAMALIGAIHRLEFDDRNGSIFPVPVRGGPLEESITIQVHLGQICLSYADLSSPGDRDP